MPSFFFEGGGGSTIKSPVRYCVSGSQGISGAMMN
ncbi:unnamed protein product [Brassica oleracea]